MERVLVVADAGWVRNQIRAALAGDVELDELADSRKAVDRYRELRHDAVVLDLQIGSMGGMATVRAIRSASLAEGWGHVPLVMMLDRSADEFIARRAGADAWFVKPANAHEIREALTQATTAPASATS